MTEEVVIQNNKRLYRSARVRDGYGYWLVLCKGHHRASKQSCYVREHILVFERTHNCCVLGYELACIHHINGNKGYNRPENLEGMSRRQHRIFHTSGNNNPMYGKTHSFATRLKIGLKSKGRCIQRK
jgi:hypothetical protein